MDGHGPKRGPGRDELSNVSACADNKAVTEDSGSYVVQKPRKRTVDDEIADYTMMVRVPGRTEALSVFTDAEVDEANRYAAETGGTVVPLPLDPPSGYTLAEASGALVPAAGFNH